MFQLKITSEIVNPFRRLAGLLLRGSARRKASAYTGQHNTEESGHKFMPRVRSEHTIPMFETSRTAHMTAQTQ
jgi:hypothetical protein